MRVRQLCLAGWVLALAVELWYAAQFPPKVVLMGSDVTHDQAIQIAHQFVWILVGLLCAGAAIFISKWRFVGPLIASLIYFIWRYGAGTIRHGLMTDYRMKWAAASGLHYEVTFLVQDVLLPILFLVVIVFTLRENFALSARRKTV
jgi:hypothetical protein